MFWTTAIPLRRADCKSNSQSLFLFFSECDVNFEKPRKDEVDLLKVKKRTERQSSTFSQSVAGVLEIIQSGGSNFDLFRCNIKRKKTRLFSDQSAYSSFALFVRSNLGFV